MTCLGSITTVLRMIEERKRELLTIDMFSHEAFVSASYLQHLFKLITGQALMDYARGRKLAHSLSELFDTDLRVADIAQEYGFKHEQSYIRAFSKEYGCTPGAARQRKHILPIRERIATEDLRAAGQGLLYGATIVFVPTFHVIGKPHIFMNFDDDSQGLEPNRIGLEFFNNERERISKRVVPEVYIGHGRYLSVQNNDVEYTPSVLVKNLDTVPHGLIGRTIPASSCTRFVYVGEHHYEELSMVTAKEIYDAVFGFFRKQSRYVPLDNTFVERIDKAMCGDEYCRLEMMCPVRDTSVS